MFSQVDVLFLRLPVQETTHPPQERVLCQKPEDDTPGVSFWTRVPRARLCVSTPMSAVYSHRFRVTMGVWSSHPQAIGGCVLRAVNLLVPSNCRADFRVTLSTSGEKLPGLSLRSHVHV